MVGGHQSHLNRYGKLNVNMPLNNLYHLHEDAENKDHTFSNDDNNNINDDSNYNSNRSESRLSRSYVLRSFGMFESALDDDNIDDVSYYRARDKWPHSQLTVRLSQLC